MALDTHKFRNASQKIIAKLWVLVMQGSVPQLAGGVLLAHSSAQA